MLRQESGINLACGQCNVKTIVLSSKSQTRYVFRSKYRRRNYSNNITLSVLSAFQHFHTTQSFQIQDNQR